jgi:phospholipase/carboxylesterase
MNKGRSSDVARAGTPLANARMAMILLHGRGATAESMLPLTAAFAQPNLAYLAPQAPDHTWYPYSFLAPYEQNEPALTRALGIVQDLLDGVTQENIPLERTVLLGFSQGGCLAMEFAARNAKRYGAVVGLSAGLIGPPGAPRNYAGSLARTPIFIGCGDVDSHIPIWRVHESTRVLRDLGANVTERVYPGMGHTINDDEIRQVTQLIAQLERRGTMK